MAPPIQYGESCPPCSPVEGEVDPHRVVGDQRPAEVELELPE